MKLIRLLLIGCFIAPAFCHAALLNIAPNNPSIDFSGAGSIGYDAQTGIVSLIATPNTLYSINPFIYSFIQSPSSFTLGFQVDNQGHVLTNSGGTPDLLVTGQIDTDYDGIFDYTGTLLTAYVTDFGFLNGASGSDDFFDVRLNNIGGALAGLYNNQDIGIRITSESSNAYSNPFSGNFTSDWLALAKGTLGAIAPSTSFNPIPVSEPPSTLLWLSLSGWLLASSARRHRQHN